jgi:pimeloyl-ACP methyl ester carboxylesterase
MQRAIARFVLVHGAFGGAWVWDDIVGELERAGHSARAFDLPGSGDDPSPVADATLDNYARRICEVLAEEPEPAILVGHSMGGVAITQAAARCRERVAMLVFVAAFMPQDGQSLLDLTRLPEGAGDQVQANITIDGDPPVATMPPEARAAINFRASDEQIQRSIELHRPQPVEPFGAPVSIPAGALDGLPRAYVHCTEDPAIPPPLQLRMIRENPCVDVVEIDTDHSPQLSATAELLVALGRFAALAGPA